jgi:uncharacterized membrane protein
MRRLASRLAGALLILALVLAPLAAHLALATHRDMTLAGVLIASQAALVGWIALSPMLDRLARACTCGAVFLGVLGLSRFASGGPVTAAAVPHAMTYLTLLVLFGASLRPEREAVVTVLARRSRGHLPANVVRYTRRVTWAWCGFFLAQLAGSLLLLLFAPLRVWSLVISLGNLPLIAVMLCGEYIYRQWRYAARPPERLIDMVRIARNLGTAAVSDGR